MTSTGQHLLLSPRPRAASSPASAAHYMGQQRSAMQTVRAAASPRAPGAFPAAPHVAEQARPVPPASEHSIEHKSPPALHPDQPLQPATETAAMRPRPTV